MSYIRINNNWNYPKTWLPSYGPLKKIIFLKYKFIIIIIIIKKGQQCKAEREWYTPISPKTPAPQY